MQIPLFAGMVVLGVLLLGIGALGLFARQKTTQLRRTRLELNRLRTLNEQRVRNPSVLSHEIRTPLTVVQGAAEILQNETAGPLNPAQRQFAQTIAENSNLIIGMANDFLAQVRLDSEMFNLKIERFEMRNLVRECVSQLRRVHECPIRLANHGAPIYVEGDARLIRQAVTNVINNSARHAGENVSILVSLQDAEEQVTICVSDDGQGMSQSDREVLFLPFATGSSRRPGSGLGMMITQRILELHGGKVTVDTIAKVGTTIFLSLPRSQRFTNGEE